MLYPKEKLNEILRLATETGISPYQIHKDTSLNESAVRNILNRKTKAPHTKTVDTLYDYFKVFELKSKDFDYDSPVEFSIPNFLEERELYKLTIEEKVALEVEKLLQPYFEELKEILKK